MKIALQGDHKIFYSFWTTFHFSQDLLQLYSRTFPGQVRNHGKNPRISKTQIIDYTTFAKMSHV